MCWYVLEHPVSPALPGFSFILALPDAE